MAVMKEVATRNNMDFSIEQMAFDGLIGALGSGKINAIAAGMTITDERKAQVDFSDPYVKSVQVVLAKIGSPIKTADDLKGKTIAVQLGTTGDFLATDITGATITRLNKYLDAITEMINGKADAVIIDSSPAKSFIAQYSDKIAQIPNLELANEEYGFAVKKGDTALLNKINASLTAMKADGAYDKIYKQYIG
jgi:polar amino acid transport system substrate-binding protein